MAERSVPRHAPAPQPAPRPAAPAAHPEPEPAVVAEAAAPEEPVCPHCGGPMVKHEGEGPKHGAWHCDACGGCWVHRGSAWFTREGHVAPDGWAGG